MESYWPTQLGFYFLFLERRQACLLYVLFNINKCCSVYLVTFSELGVQGEKTLC